MENKTIKFKDLNFKLAVIQELMYDQSIIVPEFDVYEFVESYTRRKIDIEEEGYDPIPEVLKYFEDIEISTEWAEHVDELIMDGGDEIYLQICPFWDGEDNVFNIKSADDAVHFPNLKKITLFYDEDESILGKFHSKGVEAQWL